MAASNNVSTKLPPQQKDSPLKPDHSSCGTTPLATPKESPRGSQLTMGSNSPRPHKSVHIVDSWKHPHGSVPNAYAKAYDFATKLAESNRTPKLTPKNTQNLAQLKIAPELKYGKSASSTNPSPRSIRSVRSEERPLLGAAQKVVIVPNRAQLKVGSGSSDSSEGRRTPPRKRTMSGGKKRAPGVKMSPSLKSLGGNAELNKMRTNASWASFFPDPHGQRPLTDLVSVRSLASIGMGSTDGKKLTIRRVPTSPSELLNLADPRT